jgi:hypothetical protein
VGIMNRDHEQQPSADRLCWLDAGVVELSLLLPVAQVLELERAAHARGLTLGQFLRLLLHNALHDGEDPGPGHGRDTPVGR